MPRICPLAQLIVLINENSTLSILDLGDSALNFIYPNLFFFISVSCFFSISKEQEQFSFSYIRHAIGLSDPHDVSNFLLS